MRNVERVIGMIRTGAYPEDRIEPLIAEDASAMTERVVTSTNATTVRRLMIEFTRQVYAAAAEIVRREVNLRATAALDAADAVARWKAQRDEAVGLVYDMVDSGHLTDEERVQVEKAPVFVARVMIGGHDVRHALRMLAERDAKIEALKTKAERS